MIDSGIIAFTVAVGALTLVPGADTMLVMRNVLSSGRRAGLLTTLGIGSGLFVQAALSGLGLSAILMRSAQAYSAVKLVGALYLAGLGAWTIIWAWRSRDTYGPQAEKTLRPRSGNAYFEGLLTNVLNPKVAVFYLAFLPQFIRPGDPVMARSMLLAGIHFALSIVWLSVITFALVMVSSWIARPDVKRRLDMGTGLVLVGLGARLAVER